MEIGKYNTLRIARRVDFGLYLADADGNEVLLPTRYVPDAAQEGDELTVFVYHDNEGRPIATTDRPAATVGEFARMRVRQVAAAGAFLEWGLMKDLLVPFREQKIPMQEGQWHIVYIYLDHITQRVVGSARIDKYLDNTPPRYTRGQAVDLFVTGETELGYKVIINHLHSGLLYRNEVFRPLRTGDRATGYIKEVREDDKIDVSLYPLGYDKIDGIADRILEALRQNGGALPVHDKSDADEIRALFGCSKKSFKQAVGALYKRHLITIESAGLRLVAED